MKQERQHAPPPKSETDSDDYFHEFLNRTIMLLGQEAVDTLRGKTAAIAGCGGQGGAAAILLARMGVGGFILADPKPFDEPDINRQWAANRETLGRNKALVYAEILRTIQPDVRLRTFTDGITEANVTEFLEGADLLIDCLDISVSPALRAKVFARARQMGIYASTGAMIGFGGFVTSASPDGIPMEFVLGFEDTTLSSADLPAKLRELFVQEHIDRLAEHLDIFRAPSVAVSPTLLASMLATEALLILLGATIPGWRPPVCIPQVLLADALSMSHRVMAVDELFAPPDQPTPAGPATGKVDAVRTGAMSVQDRRSLLAKVGNNTNLLPDEAVELDLLTDSWSEIPFDQDNACPPGRQAPMVAPAAETLRAMWGYRYIVPFFRGRFAESMLAAALTGPAGVVLTNSLFPTTRTHMEHAGYEVVELTSDSAFDPSNDAPFKGDIELTALQAAFADHDVRAVYLELSVNALGGQPVSVENLRELRKLASDHEAWVILDATRAFENAALIRRRNRSYQDKSLVSIVRELCSHSDFCACSCTKDIKTPVGGFVGSRHADVFYRLRDLALARGDGLRPADNKALQEALAHQELWVRKCDDRVGQVHTLWQRLREASVPVVNPAGGHAVYVDARAALPHIPAGQNPAQALANELYVLSGVRVAENLSSPGQVKRGQQWLRLAVPIDRYSDEELSKAASGLASALANPQRLGGLQRRKVLAGALGEFTCSFHQIGRSANGAASQ